MPKKYTYEEFVEKARKVHGDKYDYSKTDLNKKDDKNRIIITCPKHGDFPQTVKNHLRGNNCPKCSLENKTKPLEQFIAEAKERFGNKFDYSKVKYINKSTEVKIICPIHGEFEVTPESFLRSQFGCQQCAIDDRRKALEQFIAEAKAIHGDKYDYSKVVYKSALENVIIICPKHGEFDITPNNHLNGSSCLKCGYETGHDKLKMTTEEFIAKARAIHGNKYDYSKTDLMHKNDKGEVIIICPKHGEFNQKPNNHLTGRGCQICNQSHLERDVQVELENLGIEFEYNKFYKILDNLQLDFYIPSKKIAIECQGIQHFEPQDFRGKLTEEEKLLEFEKLKARDILKKKLCEENGIKLFYYSNLHIEYPYEVYEDKTLLLEEIKKILQ